ncbi:MAG TPA: hypothetical protein VFU14_19825 [Acidimicrobiales bacterium]|nr:hypothetical protein [Acidimicrobiales bacterium]
MPAEIRFAAVLVGSLLLGSPAIAACLSGEIGSGTAATRVAGAVALSWLVVRVLGAIVQPATPADDRGADGPAGAEDDPDVPRRRADDAPVPDEPTAEPSDDREVAAAAER